MVYFLDILFYILLFQFSVGIIVFFSFGTKRSVSISQIITTEYFGFFFCRRANVEFYAFAVIYDWYTFLFYIRNINLGLVILDWWILVARRPAPDVDNF